jgi:FtsP/CotA-like multicopper oxidase with cupredoxin domain
VFFQPGQAEPHRPEVTVSSTERWGTGASETTSAWSSCWWSELDGSSRINNHLRMDLAHQYRNTTLVLTPRVTRPTGLPGRPQGHRLYAPKSHVRLAVSFGEYADPVHPYMYHCHILRHEDEGMLGAVHHRQARDGQALPAIEFVDRRRTILS